MVPHEIVENIFAMDISNQELLKSLATLINNDY